MLDRKRIKGKRRRELKAFLKPDFSEVTSGCEPSLPVCNPEYLVPVASQDKLAGLRQVGHPA